MPGFQNASLVPPSTRQPPSYVDTPESLAAETEHAREEFPKGGGERSAETADAGSALEPLAAFVALLACVALAGLGFIIRGAVLSRDLSGLPLPWS